MPRRSRRIPQRWHPAQPFLGARPFTTIALAVAFNRPYEGPALLGGETPYTSPNIGRRSKA